VVLLVEVVVSQIQLGQLLRTHLNSFATEFFFVPGAVLGLSEEFLENLELTI
jgi:hypothetical protein